MSQRIENKWKVCIIQLLLLKVAKEKAEQKTKRRYLQQVYLANDSYPEYIKNAFQSIRKRRANRMMGKTHNQAPYREECGKGQ